MPLYLEDLEPGRIFHGGPVTLSEEAIIAFATQYDPQPFHTDPVAAKAHPLFQGLAASGWHTAALSMRMITEAMSEIAGGVVGGGGELQWPRPTRPGDTLRLECEVLEVTPSRSRPERGSYLVRHRTLNQHGEEVQVFTVRGVILRRPAG
ncbi:MaoC family dehydratase [Plastoroseomonas arctica]|uniref:MaoC family dehydratase n=1 Tax=Plastoroseomonas arctica TaxID=1509237 RepID=A0AAF1KI39_9PROT|nr:MaoC family dehydratase [Plastoroseomonas arctica]MBR0654689.1 MaoC family dehydratase [Plastoroseomonas arctica]